MQSSSIVLPKSAGLKYRYRPSKSTPTSPGTTADPSILTIAETPLSLALIGAYSVTPLQLRSKYYVPETSLPIITTLSELLETILTRGQNELLGE